MNLLHSTIDALYGRSARRLGASRSSRRRTAHRFLSDYVVERFEPRVVPAQVAPVTLYDAGDFVLNSFAWNQQNGTVSLTVTMTDQAIQAGKVIPIGMASYTHAYEQYVGIEPYVETQKLYDWASGTLSPSNPTLTLTVRLDLSGKPGTCYQQVDGFVGDLVTRFDHPVNNNYDGRIFGSLYYVPGCTEPTPTPPPKPKGNNGIGNGVDPPPPGNPKPNDTPPDDHPGSPGWHLV